MNENQPETNAVLNDILELINNKKTLVLELTQIHTNDAVVFKQIIEALMANDVISDISFRFTESAITLTNPQINTTKIKDIADLLSNNPNLVRLKISNISLTTHRINILGSALKNNKVLKMLALPDCSMGGPSVACLQRNLRHNVTLTHLDISNNPFGVKGIKSLIEFKNTNITLYGFNLTNCNISFTLMNHFLLSPTVRELIYLDHIPQQRKQMLVDTIIEKISGENSSLFKLKVNLSNVNSENIQAISRALSTNFELLELPNFGNPIIADYLNRNYKIAEMKSCRDWLVAYEKFMNHNKLTLKFQDKKFNLGLQLKVLRHKFEAGLDTLLENAPDVYLSSDSLHIETLRILYGLGYYNNGQCLKAWYYLHTPFVDKTLQQIADTVSQRELYIPIIDQLLKPTQEELSYTFIKDLYLFKIKQASRYLQLLAYYLKGDDQKLCNNLMNTITFPEHLQKDTETNHWLDDNSDNEAEQNKETITWISYKKILPLVKKAKDELEKTDPFWRSCAPEAALLNMIQQTSLIKGFHPIALQFLCMSQAFIQQFEANYHWDNTKIVEDYLANPCGSFVKNAQSITYKLLYQYQQTRSSSKWDFEQEKMKKLEACNNKRIFSENAHSLHFFNNKYSNPQYRQSTIPAWSAQYGA